MSKASTLDHLRRQRAAATVGVMKARKRHKGQRAATLAASKALHALLAAELKARPRAQRPQAEPAQPSLF